MGPSRGLGGLALAALLALLAPSNASAQGTGNPPPPGGGGAAAQAGTGVQLGATDNGGAGTGAASPSGGAGDKKPASSGNVGGVSFQDKPARRASAPSRAVSHRAGPIATFPGFEQLPDGGSRLFVQLSQTVPVEERRAQGTVTYVLKGAHLRVHNDANALVTVHFNTPVFRARLAPAGNDLLFILEMRSAATPTFKLTGNQDKSATLEIDFAKGDFLGGNASDALPPETPTRALGRVPKTKGNAGRGQNGAASPAPAPTPDTQAPANDPGPNP